jgi:PAS domain S-box-containing protein
MLDRKAGSEPWEVRSPLPGYGIAVLVVGLVLLLKMLLNPLTGEESPFLLFFGAVMLGAWFGGLGPGLLATALAALAADYFFLSPAHSLLVDDPGQGLLLALFVLEGCLLSLLVATMLSARRQSEERASQSRRDQEDLRRSEERFRATFDQAAVGIAHVGFGGEWLRVNQKLCDIVGYTREELLERTFQDITHPDDLQENLDLFVPLMSGEMSTFSMEKRYLRKDGSIVWINLTVSAACDGKGSPGYSIAVIEDITERKRVEDAQRFLAEAGAALSSSLDYRATLSSVAHLAVPYLADWCVVDILDEDGFLDRVAVVHQDPRKVAMAHELQQLYPPDPDESRGVARVLRTGRSELVAEIPELLVKEAARDDKHREILQNLGLRSYVVVPLVARGRTLGAITLVSAESGRRYGPTDLELTEELARRAALAVDNARLYRERSETARALQGSLLPSRLPDVPGVEVGLRYLPAGEADVGGDFYDIFDMPVGACGDPEEISCGDAGSAWGVVIGDVCGKGAEAAAVLALARYTIRAMVMREECPSAILAGLNEAMLRQRRERDDHKFCTVACIRVETDAAERGARVNISLGGHPAPVLLGADGSVRRLGDTGRVLGVFDDPKLTAQEARLAPGDALVLYTDGVTEARSPDGAFFGEERLVSLLCACAGLDASTLAGRVERAVLDFQENYSRDDLAVLVLRVPE